MCLGIDPNPHTSIYKKVEVVIGNNGCINELCLQWVPYIPGTTANDCSVAWKRKPAARLNMRDLCMPYNNMNKGASSPLGPLEYHRSDRIYSAQPNATVNTNTYRYPHVSPDPIQVGPF